MRKVLKESTKGSQSKSFIINVSLRKPGVCLEGPESRLSIKLPILTRISLSLSPRVPPSFPPVLFRFQPRTAYGMTAGVAQPVSSARAVEFPCRAASSRSPACRRSLDFIRPGEPEMAFLYAHCQNVRLLMHRRPFAPLHREMHHPHTLVLKVQPKMLWIDTHWVTVGEKSRRNNLGPGWRLNKPLWCLLRK
jgi:hypothetical protein